MAPALIMAFAIFLTMVGPASGDNGCAAPTTDCDDPDNDDEYVSLLQRRAQLGLGYIAHPMPATPEEMRREDTTGMVPTTLLDHQVIYGYPSAEDKFVSGSLANNHQWEAARVSRICDEFQKVEGRADFMDVGANIGSYSIPLAVCLKERGFSGKVIAVEGMPSIAKHLEASVAKNGLQDVINVYNYAVSDGTMKADSVKMNLSPTNKGGSSILGAKPKGLVEGGDIQNGPAVDAKVTTLDSILWQGELNQRRVFAMKMDVEGFEGHALKGAELLLKSAPPCILELELNANWLRRAGTPKEMVLETLRTAGYQTPDAITESFLTAFFYQKDFKACRSRFAN